MKKLNVFPDVHFNVLDFPLDIVVRLSGSHHVGVSSELLIGSHYNAGYWLLAKSLSQIDFAPDIDTDNYYRKKNDTKETVIIKPHCSMSSVNS
jgi:hypothetical protein